MPISIKLTDDGGFTNTVCTHLYATMPTAVSITTLLHRDVDHVTMYIACTEFLFDPAAEAVLMRPWLIWCQHRYEDNFVLSHTSIPKEYEGSLGWSLSDLRADLLKPGYGGCFKPWVCHGNAARTWPECVHHQHLNELTSWFLSFLSLHMTNNGVQNSRLKKPTDERCYKKSLGFVLGRGRPM